MASRSTTTPGPTSLLNGMLPISWPLVIKCSGASRWVPTCRVDEINWPPTFSKAGRLIHLTVGPSYVAKEGVFPSQFWDRSMIRMLLRSGMLPPKNKANITTSILCRPYWRTKEKGKCERYSHFPEILLSALILHRAQDNLINELLYRGAVIGEKDGAAMNFAYFSKLDAVLRHLRQQWIGQRIEVILEITERGVSIGADDHGIGETRRIDEID